jgi:hypothetical protein
MKAWLETKYLPDNYEQIMYKDALLGTRDEHVCWSIYREIPWLDNES